MFLVESGGGVVFVFVVSFYFVCYLHFVCICICICICIFVFVLLFVFEFVFQVESGGGVVLRTSGDDYSIKLILPQDISLSRKEEVP